MNLGCVIAIDGPSGAGKSTVARELAMRLGYRYIDTGAMYRAAALAAERAGIAVTDIGAGGEFLRGLQISQDLQDGKVITRLGAEDVSEAIRRAEMGLMASAISVLPAVRERLVSLQREMAREGGVVMEGRDIGTVVFPDADYKFFLTASDEMRARRRFDELVARGEAVNYETVLEEIRKRDYNDTTREVAPLRRDPTAREIDSTGKTVSEVVEELQGAMSRPRTGLK